MKSLYFSFVLGALLMNATILPSQELVGDIIEGLSQDHWFGYSVDISNSGNKIVVGAIGDDVLPDFGGYARVMEFDGNSWVQMGSLIEGINDDDQAGTWVSMSGDGEIIAIGAPRFSGIGNSLGHIRVFQWDGSDWAQIGEDINGEFIFDELGRSIDLSDDGFHIAVGNFQADPNGFQSGLAKVFSWNGTDWEQLGQTINGDNEGDRTGEAVVINNAGSRLAIGSPRSNVNGEASGEVRIYDLDGNQWVQVGQSIIGEGELNFTGQSLSFNALGNTILVGEPQNNDFGSQAGQARVFAYDGTNWTQLGQDLNGEAEFDLYGISTSINDNGTVIAVGSYFNDGNGSASGHTRLFQYNGTDWVQSGEDIDGTEAGDASAYSISLNSIGDRIVIGSPFNDDNGEDSGHVRVFANNNLGISDSQGKLFFEIALNNFNEVLRLKARDFKIKSLIIYTINGRVVTNLDIENPTSYFEMDTSYFAKGPYFIKVQSDDGQTTLRTILKH